MGTGLIRPVLIPELAANSLPFPEGPGSIKLGSLTKFVLIIMGEG
jgi:hypothetical protein